MRIIENCVHPAHRDALHRYLQAAPMGHIRPDLRHCFDMDLNYLRTRCHAAGPERGAVWTAPPDGGG